METSLKALIERFRSKPEWQHPDPAVRAEAVLRLPASEEDVLLALAREDTEARVRRAAVKRLSGAVALAAIAASDADGGVREEAESRLAHLALHEHDEGTAKAAVAGLREARHLAAVAKAAPLATVREAAVAALTDARALASIVRESEDTPTRLLALARIDDGATLLAIALKTEHKALAVAAVDRISDPEALRTVAAKARAGAALRRARARLDAAGTTEATSSAPVPGPSEQEERERQAYEAARAAHEKAAAERAQALAAHTALCDSVERAEGEAIPAALDAVTTARASLPPLPGPEAEACQARLKAALLAAERRHAAYLTGLTKREELKALVLKAEGLAAEADVASARAGFAALEARWREATVAADLPELRARFEGAAERYHAREQALRQEHAQKEQEHLARLTRLAERAEGLVRLRPEEVALRDADHTLREIREALEHPGHFPSRRDREQVLGRLEAARKLLYPLVQQLREDAEWKRWANVTVQEELCARAETLLREEDHEKAARELRDLDARWKQAKEAPKERAEALWTRFKAAREQVKVRTDAFFAKQAEELGENLRKKLTLCERAEALAESTEWIKTAEELRQLQLAWKQIGPVPRAQSQKMWERFRRPCDRFFRRWQEHRSHRNHEWAENLARKEALCEKAETLAESTDWEEAAAGIKQLQVEWRTIGAVKKSRSEAVWQRFRTACDRFFDRYKNRDEHARQATLQARESILADLESLLPAEGATAAEAPADLVSRVQAAQTAWRQAGELLRELMGPLDERFARVRDRLVELFPHAFSGTDLDPEASRRKAEKLAARVEGLLQELAPGSGAPLAATAEELAARLRDALAANTIGGRAAVEAKWQAASTEVEAAQTAWKRLGPMPGPEGHALAARFEKACRRFYEVRPRPERPRARSGPGRGPRPRS